MPENVDSCKRYAEAIRRSGLTIYDPVPTSGGGLWIPLADLERVLDSSLRGVHLAGLPLRTRSKVVKELVCRALGYPVPRTFRRTRPRFLGQRFDVYVQKSANLQIWNEDIEASRRYVIVRMSEDETVAQVRVVTGQDLASLDTTGTLTRKYQARLIPTSATAELGASDTCRLSPLVATAVNLSSATPTSAPRTGELLGINDIFERLRPLLTVRIRDPGVSQERARGAALHQLVCERIGFGRYADDGRFPDVRHQLLEVKLQTSPTIDLGAVDPHSDDALDVPPLDGVQPRHCDVRYAVFFGTSDGVDITLSRLFVTTGEMFFTRFAQFQGNVLNRKLQIPLPLSLFKDVDSWTDAKRLPDH